MSVEEDARFMARALEWAQKSVGHTRPNPPVGAVIVKNGLILGSGRHEACGMAHAEVAALEDVARTGRTAEGATMYISLEPCSKAGRVGACCDALVAAKLKRVVWAINDPNPVNRGRAFRVLGRAGIETECWERFHDVDRKGLVQQAKELIRPFEKHVLTGKPFVTVKMAISLDGKTCDDMGSARWVSSERARKRTDLLRANADVIMVGAETIRKDNPSLLCRAKRNDDLWRAVVSKSGKLPKDARVFTDAAKDRTLVYDSVEKAITDLGKRGFMHVLCEGGLELARSLAKSKMVDEWITVLAPIVIGHNPIAKSVRVPITQILQDIW